MAARRRTHRRRAWRNVRTHTLHNPAEFKLRTVGNWFLNDALPEPGYYS
ncbi:hypothetical protein NZD89_12790 [Alicyclobacillus fastidiosus]|uniref:Acyl-CoA dehydrogenase C-terminal domain-containing protein n=1 Tax=Alicyclobacillus fastidiosus TaxID=392011 RepID=A0ABY6ZMK8_9BACL|nr:hypothetical protein [Alicyclobacillus fastidiosus]WAH44173.1 hypothetical protein NZD89_12790 [Alicyclobacillus fastidiosus]